MKLGERLQVKGERFLFAGAGLSVPTLNIILQ